jgi:O-antigen/teichoic acid export membrane protein
VALLTPISVVAIAALGPFLHVWIGPSLASAGAPVGAILIAGFWVQGIGHVPSTILLGRGRPDILTKLLLAYLVPYLLILYVLTVQFGIIGASIAWSLRAACDPILFFFTKPDSASVGKIIQSATVILAAMATALLLSWDSALYWLLMMVLLGLSGYLGRESLSHWLNRASAWVRVPDRA